jgi:hypothetical protein
MTCAKPDDSSWRWNAKCAEVKRREVCEA